MMKQPRISWESDVRTESSDYGTEEKVSGNIIKTKKVWDKNRAVCSKQNSSDKPDKVVWKTDKRE